MDADRPAKTPPSREGVTPMMAQFLDVKEQAGEALLFYRMGDFYELFFEDAVKAAEALDIALTKRGKHLGEDIPMCGVPAATAETYLSRLIRKGFRVAVCEQTEDPKEAKKRGSKAVVRREIVRVVTPGTLTEDSLLDARSANYLACVARLGSGEMAMAWADVSTGEFCAAPLETGALPAELAALGPSEVIASESACEARWMKVAMSNLGGASLTPLPDANFSAAAGERRLKDHFAVASLEAFGDFTRSELAAAGALLDYMSLTQAGGAPALAAPRRAASAAYLRIDPATRASLEIERTMRGDKAGSLLHAIDRTVTGPGARCLHNWLSRPLVDPAAISARHDGVEFFLDQSEIRADLRAALKASADLARALSRLQLQRGGPRDLLAIGTALRQCEEICALFAEARLARPPDSVEAALSRISIADKPQLAELARDLGKAFRPEPPLRLSDGGFIAEGWAAPLDEARKLKDESRRVIASLQADYADKAGIKALKVKHNNVLGYFVEVSAKNADAMMRAPLSETFIHRQTMANAVRFSTVELSELESKIAGAADRAQRIEEEIFREFCGRADGEANALRAAAEGLAELDVFAALAEEAARTDAVRPAVDSSLCFGVDGGRHPVVEAALKREGEPFTPNDCKLDGDAKDCPRLTFVTGPNMAGKSTYLRQNALFVILAQAGAFIPARTARIGVVDRLFSRVGAADDLARGRSTFMAEMIETAAILNQASPRSFVILDEIGRGTATFDGLAIAWACAEHLLEVNKSRALFATHYHELTSLAESGGEVANVSLKAREWQGDLVFLHEVGPGAADRSYGVQVAKLAGLPSAATRRAEAVLKRLESDGPGEALRELPLFAAAAPEPERESEVENALKEIDPDAVSPKEALEILYRLKRLGGGEA